MKKIPDRSVALAPDQFKTLFETLPGLFLVLLKDFRIIAATEEYLRATKTKREKIIGRTIFEVFPDNPSDLGTGSSKSLRNSLEQVVKTRRPETMAVQKYDIPLSEEYNGPYEEKYWSPVNTPILDDKNEIKYIIHRVEDVTEFIKLQQKGNQLNANYGKQMEAEIIQRAQEIQGANRQLQIANEALNLANQRIRESEKLKDEFFANVSHELRTPLTLILAPLETLITNLKSKNSDDENRLLQMIHGNSVRLLQMISGLLDFSKIEARKQELKRVPTDIIALTRSIMADFTPLAENKKISLHLDSPVPTAFVTVDRYVYERILFNLLSNAIKFTPSAGRIETAVTFDGDRMSVCVTDSGIGIAEADQKNLFQKFRQVEGASTRRYEGTGLGLALAKEFVGLLDGTIKVRSETGKGSAFTCEFSAPRAAKTDEQIQRTPAPFVTHPTVAAPAERKEEAKVHALKARAYKVLVAEDNPELADYIASQLVTFCEVRLAPDGEAAREIAHAWSPDLVLSDVMMPKSDGLELCRALKQSVETAHIPVVLLTALTHRDAMLKGWESGADEYLFKPFHPQELQTRVRAMLSLVNARKAHQAECARRQELEDFAYFASHDLKEPLRNVSTFTQLLKKRYAGAFDEDGDRFLSLIVNATGRMQQLVNDLIAYAVVNREAITDESSDSGSALESAISDLNVLVQETGAEIKASEMPRVRGNLSQLTLLFQNLIGNAIKYRGPSKPEISVEVRPTGGEWLFTVRDNGIGFEQRFADQIFIIFKRLHGTEKYPGTGMGLAICKRIVELLDGKIWAESTPNHGATFFFTLPDAEAGSRKVANFPSKN